MKTKLTLIISMSLCLAVSAFANLVDMTFSSPGPLSQGGFYVGPYNFTVDNQSTKLVCNDFTDEVSAGEKWTANVYTFNDLSHTKFASEGLKTYSEGAWLYEQGLLNPGQWGDIQYALWAVFNPTSTKASSGWTAGSANWLATAEQQTFTANEFNGLSIYTPTQLSGSGAPQEFFGGTPTIVAVPEPNVGMLLGLGALGVIVVRRYQQRNVAS